MAENYDVVVIGRWAGWTDGGGFTGAMQAGSAAAQSVLSGN